MGRRAPSPRWVYSLGRSWAPFAGAEHTTADDTSSGMRELAVLNRHEKEELRRENRTLWPVAGVLAPCDFCENVTHTCALCRAGVTVAEASGCQSGSLYPLRWWLIGKGSAEPYRPPQSGQAGWQGARPRRTAQAPARGPLSMRWNPTCFRADDWSLLARSSSRAQKHRQSSPGPRSGPVSTSQTLGPKSHVGLDPRSIRLLECSILTIIQCLIGPHK